MVTTDAVPDPFFLGSLNSPLIRNKARSTKKRRRTTMMTIVSFSLTMIEWLVSTG